MRLIDADELKTYVFQPTGTVHESYIDSAPTVDAVKHGYWKQVEEPLGWQEVTCVECSVCGESWVSDEDFGFDEACVFWNYCPNCGAKMGGKEDEGK